MTPQYQFNLGQADPLLSIAQNNPEGYISVIEQELQKLNNVKQQLIQAKQPTQQNINNAINIWDSINNEIASMTNDQKELLAKDETYISIERELQLMIQEELINSVKDKVAASPRGKELLEKQLNNIKVKKEEIIKEANKNIGKLDGLLKAIEDKDGKVDIEGILSESIDNLVVAQVKKYPNVFSGVEIGGGTIKINIPSFDKQLVFDYNDIETFKQNILN